MKQEKTYGLVMDLKRNCSSSRCRIKKTTADCDRAIRKQTVRIINPKNEVK